MSSGNYEVVDMEARARAALTAHKEYVEKSLCSYNWRRAQRLSRGLPTLAFLGRGRAGKDTSAQYLCGLLGLTYAGSSSDRLSVFVAHMAGVTREEAFADRHLHRSFWKEAGDRIRGHDLTLLVKLTLGWGDMVVGLRGGPEVRVCRQEGLVDCRVWVENPRVPPDMTVEFNAEDCDLMVLNTGSKSLLYDRLDALASMILCGKKEQDP